MVDRRGFTLDRIFAAVSDGTRRSFLQRLAQQEATISDLAKPLTMSLEGASKHVRVLQRAGLVSTRRVGRAHIVRLNAGPLADAAAWLEHYRAFWATALDRLAAYVESTEDKPRSQKQAKLRGGHDDRTKRSRR